MDIIKDLRFSSHSQQKTASLSTQKPKVYINLFKCTSCYKLSAHKVHSRARYCISPCEIRLIQFYSKIWFKNVL